MEASRPFHAYTGNGKYVCVSYARKDAPAVYNIIRQLYLDGYNLWYDEGAPEGEELTMRTNKAIRDCELFLMFVSPVSVGPGSVVLRQLAKADGLRKPTMFVNIEGFGMPDGMELQFHGESMLSGSPDEIVELLAGKLPASCREASRRSPDDFRNGGTDKEGTGVDEDLEYIYVDDLSVAVAHYAGNAEQVDIPETREDLPVVRIENAAFLNCESIKHITLPQSLISIGYSSFCGCVSLKEIEIPHKVTALAAGAFFNCTALESVKLTDSITAISDSCFACCGALSTITIPSSVIVIGDDAFRDCPHLIIECVDGSYAHWYSGKNNIPFRLISQETMEQRTSTKLSTGGQQPAAEQTVSRIEAVRLPHESKAPAPAPVPVADAAPTNASADSSIVIAPKGENYAYICFADEDRDTVEPIIKRLRKDGIELCRSANPTTGAKAYKAAYSAISKSNLFIFFQSRYSVDSERCLDNELDIALSTNKDNVLAVVLEENARLPSDIKYRFDDDSIIIRAGKTNDEFISDIAAMANSAGCGKTSLPPVLTAKERKALFTHPDFEYSVTSSGATITKYKGDLSYVEVPAKLFGYGVTEIGDHAFMGCISLIEVNIPSSVTSLGNEVFKECENLQKVHLPSSILSIGYGCFRDCHVLSEINLPSSITEIGWHVFAGCRSIVSIAIPNHVTKIDSWAFDGCTSLRKISIPDKVTRIDANAFFDCSKFMVIFASKGSYAQKYAASNNFHWKKSH